VQIDTKTTYKEESKEEEDEKKEEDYRETAF
jgi:hypothetical protein